MAHSDVLEKGQPWQPAFKVALVFLASGTHTLPSSFATMNGAGLYTLLDIVEMLVCDF